MHALALLLIPLVGAAGAPLPFFSDSARIGDRFATNIHWTSGQSGEMAMLSTAYKAVRMDFSWGYIERTCGVYDFSAYDALLAEAAAQGVKLYLILDYNNNPCYPSPGKSCETPACIAGYGALAKAAAAHFQGKPILWESVNEPNGMGQDNATVITALIAAASAPFLAAGASFCGPATAGIDLPYLNQTFAAGLLDHVSAVSVHPYRSAAPEDALGDFARLFSLIAGYRKSLPVVPGEWGYTSAAPPCRYGNKRDRVLQGKYVPRMWLVDILAGAEGPYVNYDWKDDGTNATDCESNFGSVEASGDPSHPFAPKPAFLAARAAQATIGGAAAFSGRVEARVGPAAASLNITPASVFALRFEGGALPGAAAFAVYTNISTCAAGGAACGAAGATEPDCLALGCCYSNSSCFAAPPLLATCALGVEARQDCGFSGITHDECVRARGCCWEAQEPAVGGPQCYFSAPSGLLPATIPVAPAPQDACFAVTDVFGFSRGSACAVGGELSLLLTDGPVYLL